MLFYLFKFDKSFKLLSLFLLLHLLCLHLDVLIIPAILFLLSLADIVLRDNLLIELRLELILLLL